MYCGRVNDAAATLCADCGKPLGRGAPVAAAAGASAGAVTAPRSPTPGTARPPAPAPPPAAPAPSPAPAANACPFCKQPIDAHLPFCPHCGRRLTAPGSGPACARCASPVSAGTKFCSTCGAPLGDNVPALFRTSSAPDKPNDFSFNAVLLDESGNTVQQFARRAVVTTIGREEGDLRFPDDAFMSPLHAKLVWEEGGLMVRDLGSRNGTWVFLEEPRRLADGDLLLIGSQLIRFRRLGYPGPHAPEADATRRMGSMVPSADIACLVQLRSDGSSRDVVQLSPGRDVHIGRERGDWVFPYDPSMSGHHATIRSEDADFVVLDERSRNGVALAARGAMRLGNGSRVLVGDKLFRIELP